MNSLSKLSFLIMALGLAACNEKVSPELQGAASTTTGSGGSGPTIVPDVSYFRIVNKSDTLLNYKVHKTGAGNANKNCEISGAVPLSSDLYRVDPSTYDISCYFEAEELGLHLNGFSFALEASANTCAYIGYSPFSYYDRIPGDSSGTYDVFDCEGTANTTFLQNYAPYVGTACETIQTRVDGATTFTKVAGTNAFPKANFDEADLCRFNYSESDGPNCDIGKINIVEHVITQLPGVDNTLNTPDDDLQDTTTEREIDCQGKIRSCLDGPILTEPLLSKATNGIVLQKSTSNNAPSITKTYAPLVGTQASNRKYVNFRRDLASVEIEYGNSNQPLTNAYKSSFGGNPFVSSFNPELMANYANNKRMDGSQLVTTLPLTQNGRYTAIPYAGEAYVGLSPNALTPAIDDDIAPVSPNRTNPFYVAYCMDSAFDIKARIKMVVRDWDRVLPVSATSTSLEWISDVHRLPSSGARQDVPDTDEVTGDSDSWNAFNDLFDWDDTMEMERDDQNAPYDPAITVWRPVPTATYPAGFFNPAAFPEDKLSD